MNILVINASPFMDHSNTSQILKAFVSGMKESGEKVDIIYLRKHNINPCLGDLKCWFKHSGKCIQNDDMASILPLFKEADVIVFSTPVYCDGVPGQLKVLMDRTVALGNPYFEIRNDHSRHPHNVNKKRRFFLIASCGLWECDNFNPMISHLKAYCENLGAVYSGSLLRPHAFAMKNNDINDILKAAKKAGREIITKPSISEELECIVSREIMTRADYVNYVNIKVDNMVNK